MERHNHNGLRLLPYGRNDGCLDGLDITPKNRVSKELKNKELLKNPPNTTGKTKTNNVADKVAPRPIEVEAAERRAAVSRKAVPGTAPENGSPFYLRKIIILASKPSAPVRWRTFIV
ncbi:MAG: hypothetical protein AAFR83_27050, partial [Cyanobacteria bacterium J06629_18]